MIVSSKRYPSDLSNEAWEVLKKLFPKHNGAGRPRELDLRQIINAILYVIRTGCQWRALPKEYPKWYSVYYYFWKWSKDGTWRRINRTLRRMDRQRRGRNPEPTAGIIDSQTIKTTEMGGERGYDAGKKINGRKRHIVVDTLGNILGLVVHAANIQDRDGARLVLPKLDRETLDSLVKVWADGGYRGKLIAWVHDALNIILEIVDKEPGQKGFKVLPRRWVVERTFGWLGRWRRLSKDYERTIESSEGMIYIASIGTMLKRRF